VDDDMQGEPTVGDVGTLEKLWKFPPIVFIAPFPCGYCWYELLIVPRPLLARSFRWTDSCRNGEERGRLDCCRGIRFVPMNDCPSCTSAMDSETDLSLGYKDTPLGPGTGTLLLGI